MAEIENSPVPRPDGPDSSTVAPIAPAAGKTGAGHEGAELPLRWLETTARVTAWLAVGNMVLQASVAFLAWKGVGGESWAAPLRWTGMATLLLALAIVFSLPMNIVLYSLTKRRGRSVRSALLMIVCLVVAAFSFAIHRPF